MQKLISKQAARQRATEPGFWHKLLNEPGLIYKPKLMRWLSVLTTGTALGMFIGYFLTTPQAQWRTVTILSHVVMLALGFIYLWWIMARAEQDYNKIILTASLVSSTSIMVSVTLTSGLNVSPGFFLIILYWVAAALTFNWRGLVVTLAVNALTYMVLTYFDAQGLLALRQISVEWVRLINAYLLVILTITVVPMLIYGNIIALRYRNKQGQRIAQLEAENTLLRTMVRLQDEG